MIKAVVFDMDGTIADSEKIAERVTREFFQKRGIILTREEEKCSVLRRSIVVPKTFGKRVCTKEESNIKQTPII